MFQSSPGPKAGCNDAQALDARGDIVSILTRPEGRVQSIIALRVVARLVFQSSPGPKAGCNIAGWRQSLCVGVFQSSPGPKAGCNVDDRLQLCFKILVSILTRPEGRVQSVRPHRGHGTDSFQSSPGPKAGCNFIHGIFLFDESCFNPHPARRPGAILIQKSNGRIIPCFNPHPARRPGAILLAGDKVCVWECFNPHPARRPGAICRSN